MNRNARDIVLGFLARDNREYLFRSLTKHFGDVRVFRYLSDHLDTDMKHFSVEIEQELSVSDPLPGSTILSQVISFNNQFIGDRIKFIDDHVIGARAVAFAVRDGLPTSRNPLQHFQSSPGDILSSWSSNSGRGIQSREDPSGDIGPPNPFTWAGGHEGAGMSTGITFCDQREIGLQNHMDFYENTSYKRALNSGHLAHEETAFGVSTAAADERLLGRRTFRNNEAGVENAIPRYEARLYNRHLERDISEGLRNAEKDYLLSGHDMSSLHTRVDHRRSARDQYHPKCNEKSFLKVHNNSGAVPDSLRYC
jgi:hypothetical protein